MISSRAGCRCTGGATIKKKVTAKNSAGLDESNLETKEFQEKMERMISEEASRLLKVSEAKVAR